MMCSGQPAKLVVDCQYLIAHRSRGSAPRSETQDQSSFTYRPHIIDLAVCQRLCILKEAWACMNVRWNERVAAVSAAAAASDTAVVSTFERCTGTVPITSRGWPCERQELRAGITSSAGANRS
ncbi:unnamed protein product [Pleuronectes platessa]|uniref:Uncharacterized protein n=1 Tax=Pleuronectes platessa TaxID=8262 RepID=A0A9N7V9C5_PLEPL|nr:unnamed protein product [Pleuronectes platessa]